MEVASEHFLYQSDFLGIFEFDQNQRFRRHEIGSDSAGHFLWGGGGNFLDNSFDRNSQILAEMTRKRLQLNFPSRNAYMWSYDRSYIQFHMHTNIYFHDRNGNYKKSRNFNKIHISVLIKLNTVKKI